MADEGLQNLGFRSALTAQFEQGRIFIVSYPLWQGTSVYPVSPEGFTPFSSLLRQARDTAVLIYPDPQDKILDIWTKSKPKAVFIIVTLGVHVKYVTLVYQSKERGTFSMFSDKIHGHKTEKAWHTCFFSSSRTPYKIERNFLELTPNLTTKSACTRVHKWEGILYISFYLISFFQRLNKYCISFKHPDFVNTSLGVSKKERRRKQCRGYPVTDRRYKVQ